MAVVLRRCRMTSPAARRKRPRSRAEIARERAELLARTRAEVDAIAAEFHLLLRREDAVDIGAIYARYSTRFQASVPDQIRALFALAVELRIFVPRELVFFDIAVRGVQNRRPGLDGLRSTVKHHACRALLTFSSSRLFRRSYLVQQFMEEELLPNGIRTIMIYPRIDTAEPGSQWRLILQIHGAIDENGVSLYATNIQAAHGGLFARGMVCTTIPFGYAGEPVPGEFTKRNLPRRRLIIDEEQEARYVRLIFEWYTVEFLSIAAIVRRLNSDPEAPPPARASGGWMPEHVRRILGKPCYCGWFRYGEYQTVWQANKDYAKKVLRETPLQEARFSDLAIVSEETWAKAQARLVEAKRRRGRKPKDGDRQSRPKILNGIFRCPKHKRSLYVGGGFGKNMFCKACRAVTADVRPLYSELPRELALRLTCETVSRLIPTDEAFLGKVKEACQKYVEAKERPTPGQFRSLKQQIERLGNAIEFALRHPGVTPEEQEETKRLVTQLRGERATAAASARGIESVLNQPVHVPSEAEIRAMLRDVHTCLASAATSKREEDCERVREIIKQLVGDCIELNQQGERIPRRGWLQGRFEVQPVSFAVQRLLQVPVTTSDEAVEVVIDYRRPRRTADKVARAMELFEANKLEADIATELGVCPSRVTAMLKEGFAARGQEKPDGRSRRSTLATKHTQSPPFQTIADDAVRLWNETELLVEEMAERLGRDKNTITKAIRWWHESRGLPVPDGRTRRKTLTRKSSKR
jgi:site-specific DNA recombinase